VASARVTVLLLWSLPVAAVALLAAWALLDFLLIPRTETAQELGVVLLGGLASIALGLRFGVRSLRQLGFVLVVASYFGAHVLVLPMDPVAALLYLTLALLALELRLLAERFAPIYAGRLALRRSALRLAAVAGVAFLGSDLAADLAFAGTVPATTITTALLLAAALIGIVVLLALWPILERRLAWGAPEPPRIQTPK
jgi:hypothetical protein